MTLWQRKNCLINLLFINLAGSQRSSGPMSFESFASCFDSATTSVNGLDGHQPHPQISFKLWQPSHRASVQYTMVRFYEVFPKYWFIFFQIVTIKKNCFKSLPFLNLFGSVSYFGKKILLKWKQELRKNVNLKEEYFW